MKVIPKLRQWEWNEIQVQLLEVEMEPEFVKEDEWAEIDAAQERMEEELYQWQLGECDKLREHYGDNFDEYAYWDDGYSKWKERQGLNPLSLKDERIW
jgi:hypothetical protein